MMVSGLVAVKKMGSPWASLNVFTIGGVKNLKTGISHNFVKFIHDMVIMIRRSISAYYQGVTGIALRGGMENG